MFDNDTFEHEGATFRVTFPYDDSGETPWEREDGHGPVSEWRRVSSSTGNVVKAPGERELCRDHGVARFYDFAEACKIARRDGWRVHPEHSSDKPGQIAAEAAEADFQRLRQWCDNQWSYVGVVVELLDDEGEPMGDTESIWGIESDSSDYLDETAHELAGEILSRLAAAGRGVHSEGEADAHA